MFVRSAVRGVRNSWLASSTSRFCCARDVDSALNIVLKLAASRPTSSLPATGIGVLRSCVAATRSAAPVSWAIGVVVRRASAQPTSAASTMPDSAITTRRSRSTASRSSVSARLRAISTAPPDGWCAVSMR